VKPIKDRIVEPVDDADIEVLALNLFLEAGWPSEDARWLAPLCVDVLRTPTLDARGSDPACERNLELVARSWRDSSALGFRNRALFIAYARLIGCGGIGAALSQLLAPADTSGSMVASVLDPAQLARTFREHGADFESALVSSGWPGEYEFEDGLAGCQSECMRGTIPAVQEVPEIHRLMRSLVQHADLDLVKVIGTGSIVAAGVHRSGPDPETPFRVPPILDRASIERTSPRALTTWLIGLGPQILLRLLPELRRAPNNEWRTALALGIQDSIERWLFFVSGHWTYFEHAGTQLADVALLFVEELERHCEASGPGVGRLRNAWLWFALCTSKANRERLPAESRDRALRAANEELARLRPLFARAAVKPTNAYALGEGHGLLAAGSSRAAWEQFEWEREHFETCAQLLYDLGGVWRGMKPLLLALRSLACASVARDLRYWSEQRPTRVGTLVDELSDAPQPWAIVPSSMINLFQACVGREQSQDRELEELRGQLASFCLRGLADRWSADERKAAEASGRARTNEDMLERSRYWRLCLIRAAMALNINPEGKGHRILDAAARLDPEPEVREIACEAYEKLRRAKGLPDNVSPRRSIMTALWWIRQAHLLELGVEVDADGAQRTRAKELTRTKDNERADLQRHDTNSN